MAVNVSFLLNRDFLYAHWVHKVSEQHGSSCHRFRIYERHFLTLILYKVTTRVVLPQPRKMWPLFSPPRTNTISLSPGRNPLSTSGRNVITLNIRWKKINSKVSKRVGFLVLQDGETFLCLFMLRYTQRCESTAPPNHSVSFLTKMGITVVKSQCWIIFCWST